MRRLPPRPPSELGRPLPRAVTWLLLAAGTSVAIALIVPEPWRSRLLGVAIAAFAAVAIWRLRAVFPGGRKL